MKRNELVDKLISEGLSEKTLSKLTDNQLNILADRMLGEQMKKGDVVVPTNTDPNKIKQLTGQGLDVALVNKSATEGDMTENLKGNQKKIDKNHNGKIDAQDFKILNGQKKKKETNEMLRFYDDDGNPIKDKKGKQSAVSTKDKDYEKKIKSKKCAHCGKEMSNCSCDDSHLGESKPSAGLSKEKKSEVVKKAKHGDDIGKKGKGFEKLANKAEKEYGSKKAGEKVAAAAMWKNIKHESVEKNKWVNNLVENKYFNNFTSKGEIMDLIQTKLNESNTMLQHGAKVKKGHNGIPEFMSYDAIVSAAEPSTAPTKPTTKPGTKPSEPGTKPRHPYAPGRPDKEPNIKPDPKAQTAENKKKW
jgi:hypothetical protein